MLPLGDDVRNDCARACMRVCVFAKEREINTKGNKLKCVQFADITYDLSINAYEVLQKYR